MLDRGEVPLYSGELAVSDGTIGGNLTILHKRSVAEDIKVMVGKNPYNGTLKVTSGSIDNTDVTLVGKSLVHSAELTTIAFKRGFFGDFGQYIVSIGLLLFAFSTAISWSYYGDRAMTFLAGSKSVVYYRLVYVAAFFFASFADTAIIWTMANIAIVLMTVPNLVGIFLLRKDMKDTLDKYWVDFRNEWGDDTKND